MATNYVSESVDKPGGTAGGAGSRQRRKHTNCNSNVESSHQSYHDSPRDRVGAQQAATSISDPELDSESYTSRYKVE